MIKRIDVDKIEKRIRDKRLKTNPPLLEKMCFALCLVESLQKEGLSFIFKGGTSLILYADYPQRFSIDIDIITQETREKVESVLKIICESENGFFSGFLLDETRSYENSNMPKAHYKLRFQPEKTPRNDTYILLDILFEQNLYPKTESLPINKDWLDTEEPYPNITVPSIASIMGDKLTAFAPNTTGIPYEKSTELIKQLYDIGNLFDKLTEIKDLSNAFINIAKKEIEYRNLTENVENVLDDIFNVCLEILNENNLKLQNAVSSFKNWTTTGFTRDNAFEMAGKVAYLVMKIKNSDFSLLEKFDETIMKKNNFLIKQQEYVFLNKKIKNTPNNSLFYWFKAIELSCKG